MTFSRKNIPTLTPDLVQRDSQIDISLVDLVAKVMLENSSKVHKIHDRLIEILSEGTFVGKNNREKLAEGSYSNLFYLCSIGGKPDGKVIQRCIEI